MLYYRAHQLPWIPISRQKLHFNKSDFHWDFWVQVRHHLEHWCVTISGWTGMLRSVCVQTLQRLPEVDYRVDKKVERNVKYGQLDKKDMWQLYWSKIYTSLGFISKMNNLSHQAIVWHRLSQVWNLALLLMSCISK